MTHAHLFRAPAHARGLGGGAGSPRTKQAASCIFNRSLVRLRGSVASAPAQAQRPVPGAGGRRRTAGFTGNLPDSARVCCSLGSGSRRVRRALRLCSGHGFAPGGVLSCSCANGRCVGCACCVVRYSFLMRDAEALSVKQASPRPPQWMPWRARGRSGLSHLSLHSRNLLEACGDCHKLQASAAVGGRVRIRAGAEPWSWVGWGRRRLMLSVSLRRRLRGDNKG